MMRINIIYNKFHFYENNDPKRLHPQKIHIVKQERQSQFLHHNYSLKYSKNRKMLQLFLSQGI